MWLQLVMAELSMQPVNSHAHLQLVTAVSTWHAGASPRGCLCDITCEGCSVCLHLGNPGVLLASLTWRLMYGKAIEEAAPFNSVLSWATAGAAFWLLRSRLETCSKYTTGTLVAMQARCK
jgi:hypothetical protein